MTLFERRKGPRGSVRSNWIVPRDRGSRNKREPREKPAPAFRIVRDPSDGTEYRVPIVRRERS